MGSEWMMLIVMTITFLLTAFLLEVPIAFSIGIATIAASLVNFPFEQAILLITQKLVTGIDNFAFLALPFFMLSGNIMRVGGVAQRLIAVAMLLVGRLPGGLAQCNVVANTLFGTVSGSAVGAAAAVGGVMVPAQKERGYDPGFAAAVNIASCPIGMIIPPSGALITYSLLSGGTSIGGLFLAGYFPGILICIGLMVATHLWAKKHNYPRERKPTAFEARHVIIEALPAIGMILLIMGGIISGWFTATEAAAVSVVYSLALAMFLYKQIKIKDLPRVFAEGMLGATVILILIGISSAMSWAMAIASIPQMASDAMLGVSDNPIIIFLMINVILLFVGTFMDATPAKLIFIPIFLPIVTALGMHPIQFGIVLTYNLCIGLCTPPVGTALFVGSAIAEVPVRRTIPPLLPMFGALFIVLMLLTYVPWFSMYLPSLFGYTN